MDHIELFCLRLFILSSFELRFNQCIISREDLFCQKLIYNVAYSFKYFVPLTVLALSDRKVRIYSFQLDLIRAIGLHMEMHTTRQYIDEICHR